jgi:P pilus assembly chaperone PapD
MRLSASSLSLLLIAGLHPVCNQLSAAPPKAPATTPVATTQGPGDLLVSPSRVVFDLKKRTAALNLSNIGTTDATYRISLVRMEMDENGGLAEMALDKSPGTVDLHGLIRFSPREITLRPKEAQTIRLQVRKPANLPAGEYRIHMMFKAIPPTPEAAKEPIRSDQTKGISVNLIPLYGLAIPVIVRQGETSVKPSLSNLLLEPTSRTLTFQLNREGNQSMYGDLKARWMPSKGATATVAEATGVAVYVPNASRKMTLTLVAPKGAKAYASGRLKVTFSQPPTEGGKVITEAFIDLP